MKLRVKPVVGEEIVIEVDGTETILNVKQKLETQFQEYPVSQQRLLFQGKFLSNDRTVESCRLQNGCFLKLLKSLRSG